MATQGPAPAVMAAAGREAAGIARRFADRFAPRRSPFATAPMAGLSTTSQASTFTARLIADRQFHRQIDTLSSQISRLTAKITRSASARQQPVQGFSPFSLTPLVIKRTPAIRRAIAQHPAGLGATPFRPASFRPDLLSSITAVPAHPKSSLLHPQRPITAFDLPAVAAPRIDLPPEMSRLGNAPRPADEATISARIDGRAMPASGMSRPETPVSEGAGPSDDYRRLGPTALRDTLRQRGGQGAMLDFSIRARLRGTLGFDPSLARLHRGVAAADAARSLRAQAFTIGQDVFFGEGKFDTTSRAGLELITHELTHVGQQTRTARHQTRFFTAQGGDAEEEEAQKTAARLLMPKTPLLARPHGPSTTPQSWDAPEMQLAMPPPSGRNASALPAPIQRTIDPASSGRGSSGGQKPQASAVADHVYELMKQEILRDKRRGLVNVKG